MKKKALVLAISILAVVLLILGSLSQVVGYQFVQSPTLTDSISISMLDIPTIGHMPEDGVYWNHRKIAEYPVPFFLHYYFRLRAVFYPLFFFNIDNSSGINHVEYYLDDALIATIFIPPYEFE